MSRRSRSCCWGWRPWRGSCSCSGNAAPRTRSTTCNVAAPDLLGGGLRGDHRVRLADGRRLHQPAVPAERARLLDARAAGAAILPAGIFMVLVAPRSAKLVGLHGSRLHAAHSGRRSSSSPSSDALALEGGHSYWEVAIPYVLLGIGVGLAGTPSSNSLTGSVPVTRVGMASGTADLQRDLGGALMTSIFGALLTAGYASAMGAAISGSGHHVSQHAGQLQLSYCERRGSRRSAPAVRDPDHGGRPVVLPRRRPVGIPGCDGRDLGRDDARLPLLPEEGCRERGEGGIPRPGHTNSRRRGCDARSSGRPACARGAPVTGLTN